MGLQATVADFWRFALSDLRMNNARGYLAEFLVSRALGLQTVRVEWDNVDVLWGEVKIEVKSSAYVQAWPQQRPSRISFSGLRGRLYDADAGVYAASASYKADVYVFAVQTAISPESYDPLDVSSWSFYTVPRHVLEEMNVGSIGLRRLEQISTRLGYGDLRAAVAAAAEEQNPG